MSPLTFVLPVLAAFVLVCGGLILRAFFRVRGEPVVISPEGRQPVSVPALAPLGGGGGSPEAERRSGVDMESRVPAGPLDKQSLTTLRQWYVGRECAVCRREIGPVPVTEPRPGLLNIASAAREILSWNEIPPDHLQAVLDSHLPVCASCTFAESFRREFPERVTDRADSDHRDRAYH